MSIFDQQLKELNDLKEVCAAKYLNIDGAEKFTYLMCNSNAEGLSFSLPSPQFLSEFTDQGTQRPKEAVNKLMAAILLNRGLKGAANIIKNNINIFQRPVNTFYIYVQQIYAVVGCAFSNRTGRNFEFQLYIVPEDQDGDRVGDFGSLLCYMGIYDTTSSAPGNCINGTGPKPLASGQAINFSDASMSKFEAELAKALS